MGKQARGIKMGLRRNQDHINPKPQPNHFVLKIMLMNKRESSVSPL